MRTWTGWPCFVFQITSSFSSWPPRSRRRLDDARALVEVVPEPAGVDELHLFLVVAQQLAHAGVVEEQPTLLVDDVQAGRAVFEDFAELAFLLGDLRLALP